MNWKKLLESISESVNDHLGLCNDYLVAENRILRKQINGRMRLSDGERKELAEMGAKLGKKALAEIATMATPDTVLAWHRQFADQKVTSSEPPKSVGRPRVDQAIEGLVIRMARENRAWGYDRIVGALANLGYTMSDQTVGNILKRHGIPPAPARKTTTTWREFIRMHMAVLRATDFFTSALWHWCGLVCFAFLFIPFSRCKVQVISLAASLHAQCADWYVDAARWMHWVLEERLSQLCPWRTPAQPLLLVEFARHEHQPRLPQGMRKGSLLPGVNHRPIRDGPRRNRLGLSGPLQDDDRVAA